MQFLPKSHLGYVSITYVSREHKGLKQLQFDDRPIRLKLKVRNALYSSMLMLCLA